ncbi:MAG: molybdenum cofactor guanylyltransferase [Halobacteriota archaeon]
MGAGVLVCGGGSTRFGDRDKVCADLAGRPLVRHVADRIEPVVDELIVNCRAAQADCLEAALSGYSVPVRFALDEIEDAGPMHGMEQGLAATESEYAVVVACDMPFVDPEFVAALFEIAADHEAVLPRHGEGNWYQPLQAVYHADAMVASIRAAVADGVERPISPALDLDVVTIEGDRLRGLTDERTFFNVNTQADLERAEQLLETVEH